MSRWFRFHTEALDDPKVQRLDGDTFKAWVNLLCIAAKNEGRLPPLEEVAFALRMDENGARTVLERLRNAGLIDLRNGGANGSHYAPHGWGKRQYKSDTSTDRVKRFRKRSKAVTETPPDTDTETEVSVAKATGANAPVDSEKEFWDRAVAYLGSSKRPMVGKWRSEFGTTETARAISAAQAENAVEPVAYIQRVLRRSKQQSDEPIC